MNRHLPPYMPSNEDALMKWFDNYFKNLPSYAATFQIETQDIDLQKGIYAIVLKLLSILNSLFDYKKAMTELKNQGLYGKKNGSVPVPKPENIDLDELSIIGGLVELVDEQNREKIFSNPAYNDTIGKDLGLLPIKHEEPTPDQLVANSNVNCDGTTVRIFTVLTAPATAQEIYVDKHDGKGWQYVNVSEHSHYEYQPADLPKEQGLWTYKILLRAYDKTAGQPAVVNLIVKANK